MLEAKQEWSRIIRKQNRATTKVLRNNQSKRNEEKPNKNQKVVNESGKD